MHLQVHVGRCIKNAVLCQCLLLLFIMISLKLLCDYNFL